MNLLLLRYAEQGLRWKGDSKATHRAALEATDQRATVQLPVQGHGSYNLQLRSSGRRRGRHEERTGEERNRVAIAMPIVVRPLPCWQLNTKHALPRGADTRDS